MKIFAVDDESDSLELLCGSIQNVIPDAEISCFSSAEDALSYAADHPCDVVFTDIDLPGMNGVCFAYKLKALQPKANIIFATGFREYSVDAFELYASGYLLKPVTEEKIRRELDNLRYPVAHKRKGIYASTFGTFELLVNGEEVPFARSKSKEMLAYLIDRRGTGVTKKELSVILFGDEDYSRTRQDYMNKIVRELEQSLKQAGAQDIFIKKRNYYAVDPSKFTCDLYESDRGSSQALNTYTGEYMSQYSWSHFPVE